MSCLGRSSPQRRGLRKSKRRDLFFGTSAAASLGLEDFWAYLLAHSYLNIATRDFFPAASVDGSCLWPKDDDGKPMRPSNWLDKHRAIVQCVWDPAESELIEDRVMQAGSGWVRHEGARVFNLYRPPVLQPGDAALAGPWLDHVAKVYPDDAEHIIRWLACKVQNPGLKINHALVLGGSQGIGKDTLLEPVKDAVGRVELRRGCADRHLLGSAFQRIS